MKNQKTVFVVDDDEAVRDSIGMLLETVDLDHIGFDSAQKFLAGLNERTNGVLVLDIRMPGMSGLDLQKKLVDLGVAIPIIFITGHGDIPMAVEAMKKGAVDFVRKPFRDQDLLNRINDAFELGERQRQKEADLDTARENVAQLTPRETEVFQRVASGQANKVIAIELGISERTVEIHRSQAMHKTGSRTLADLVRLKLLLDQAGE